MAHAHKPDFVFRRKGRVHLNRWGASVQPTTGSRVVRISGSNAGYTMFRGSVKSTVYPLHSSVSPSLLLPASPCAVTLQLESTKFLVSCTKCEDYKMRHACGICVLHYTLRIKICAAGPIPELNKLQPKGGL